MKKKSWIENYFLALFREKKRKEKICKNWFKRATDAWRILENSTGQRKMEKTGASPYFYSNIELKWNSMTLILFYMHVCILAKLRLYKLNK